MEYLNDLVNKQSTSFLYHGVFWSIGLVLVCPVLGALLLIQTLFLCLKYIHSIIKSNNFEAKIKVKDQSKELAIYVTGCDSGFGRSVSFLLAERGFVVFSGCFTEHGMAQFKDVPSIYPLRVDVTKDSDVNNASVEVTNWINSSSSKNSRVLHAIINNSGIGLSGLIDWMDISDFERAMDVNYFGMIRTTKSFLPLLKKQASSGSYRQARIVNIVSLAGLTVSGNAAPYFSSKHAAESFSSCLRTEMMIFGISVVTLNPTFHVTDIMANRKSNLDHLWEKASPEIKEDYGKDYFEAVYDVRTTIDKISWDASNVINALVRAVELCKPPPQLIIGSDGKYFFLVIRLLPKRLQNAIGNWLQVRKIPAIMKK